PLPLPTALDALEKRTIVQPHLLEIRITFRMGERTRTALPNRLDVHGIRSPVGGKGTQHGGAVRGPVRIAVRGTAGNMHPRFLAMEVRMEMQRLIVRRKTWVGQPDIFDLASVGAEDFPSGGERHFDVGGGRNNNRPLDAMIVEIREQP